MSNRENVARIKAVHHALGDLANEVVYVGGATVALYADRPAGEARPTDDVDVVVELINYKGYAEIEKRLRARGFESDAASGVICRYKIDGITVDIMPTEENVLGFRNRWYPEVFATAEALRLDDQVTVRIFRPEYFLASKLDAYADRGKKDGRFSSDFEDIIYLLNNRDAIWNEIPAAGPQVRDYINDHFRELLRNNYLEEWISGHLEHSEQRRVGMIAGKMMEVIGEG